MSTLALQLTVCKVSSSGPRLPHCEMGIMILTSATEPEVKINCARRAQHSG